MFTAEGAADERGDDGGGGDGELEDLIGRAATRVTGSVEAADLTGDVAL